MNTLETTFAPYFSAGINSLSITYKREIILFGDTENSLETTHNGYCRIFTEKGYRVYLNGQKTNLVVTKCEDLKEWSIFFNNNTNDEFLLSELTLRDLKLLFARKINRMFQAQEYLKAVKTTKNESIKNAAQTVYNDLMWYTYSSSTEKLINEYNALLWSDIEENETYKPAKKIAKEIKLQFSQKYQTIPVEIWIEAYHKESEKGHLLASNNYQNEIINQVKRGTFNPSNF